MAELLWNKKLIMAKVESTYGTDAVPAAATEAVLTQNATMRPLDGNSVTRAVDRPHFGARGDILVDTHVGLDFEVELAGSGTAGTVPHYAALLRACGMAETIISTVGQERVEYDPVTDGTESVSIYFDLDGIRHRILGARGSVQLLLTPSQLPRLAFSFLGLYSAPESSAFPTPTYSATTPVPVNDTNTTFSLHGFSAVMQDFSLDIGNDVQGRFMVNSESIKLVNRTASGQAVIDAPLLTDKDFFAAATSRAQAALQLVHGTVAGNIVQIDAPAVEIGRPTYGSSAQGVANLMLPLNCVPSTGNDEVQITVK